MVNYKVNLKFQDNAKSLNEVITEVLKMEFKQRFNITCDKFRIILPSENKHYSQEKGRIN